LCERPGPVKGRANGAAGADERGLSAAGEVG